MCLYDFLRGLRGGSRSSDSSNSSSSIDVVVVVINQHVLVDALSVTLVPLPCAVAGIPSETGKTGAMSDPFWTPHDLRPRHGCPPLWAAVRLPSCRFTVVLKRVGGRGGRYTEKEISHR